MATEVTAHGTRTRHVGQVAATLVTCIGLWFGGASTAWAGPGLNVTSSIAPVVTVGQPPATGTLRLTNSSFSDGALGEVGYELDSYQLTDITLVPSCASNVQSADCPLGSYEAGVIVPLPTATGRPGSACANRTFTVMGIGDPAAGKYRFTVQGAPVVLGPVASNDLSVTQCIIDYTYTVNRTPTADSNIGTPGIQTEQKAFGAILDIGPNNAGLTGGGLGTSQTTVNRTTPTIVTSATPNFVIGTGQLADTADVTGVVNPVTATDQVEFRLYFGADCDPANLIETRIDTTLTYVGNVASADWVRDHADGGGHVSLAGVLFSGDANNDPVRARATRRARTRS